MSKFKAFVEFMNILFAMALAGLIGLCIAIGAVTIVKNVQGHFCATTPKDRPSTEEKAA